MTKTHSKDKVKTTRFIYNNNDYDLVFDPNSQKARYTLIQYVNGQPLESKPLTGVTTALNAVNKPFLMTWTVKEMANYLKSNCELVEGKFQVTKANIEDGMKAYMVKRDKSTDLGTKAHDFMEDYIALCIESNNKRPIPFDKLSINITKDIEHIVKRFIDCLVDHYDELLESESPICSVKYGYAGAFDLLAKDKQGKLVMVDFKTSNQIDKLYASQIEAYKRGMSEMYGKVADYGAIIRSEKLTDEEILEHNNTFMGKKYPKQPLEYIEYKTKDNWWVLFMSALAIHRTGVVWFDDMKDIESFIENY